MSNKLNPSTKIEKYSFKQIFDGCTKNPEFLNFLAK